MPIHEYVNYYEESQGQITCHVCGDEYVHFAGEPAMVESDDYPPGGIGFRGSYLAVPLYCENGEHRSVVVIQFHKGNMYVGTRIP